MKNVIRIYKMTHSVFFKDGMPIFQGFTEKIRNLNGFLQKTYYVFFKRLTKYAFGALFQKCFKDGINKMHIYYRYTNVTCKIC